MLIKKVILALALVFLLSGCQWIRRDLTPTPTLTQTPTLPTVTYYPMCTPPLCAIGTSEVYYCAETCPNGCGTTCATFTPPPKQP